MKIPIKNIYYMLSYSWKHLDESDKTYVSESDYESLLNLLAKVLIKGTQQILKQGLNKSYIENALDIQGIKGKIDFSKSMSLIGKGRTVCSVDEYESNNLTNKLLKSTLFSLLYYADLNPEIRKELVGLLRHFYNVDVIQVTRADFKRVIIHRNMSNYDLPLKICKLIFDNTTLDEKSGDRHFVDFERDDRKMAILFESFLYNFYEQHLNDLGFNQIKRETISWNLDPVEGSNTSYLPKMITDISLLGRGRKVIIDAKYYSKTLVSRFDQSKFHSNNLYQLFSYLINQETKKNGDRCAGILIYPKVDIELNETYVYNDHIISLKTIDLSQEWRSIESRLIGLMSAT